MRNFKFLTKNEERLPIPPRPITEEDIEHAISVGREVYLSGVGIENNPFLTPELYEAFEQGWELEQDYDILREARQRASEGY
jgi:hypothetical protein